MVNHLVSLAACAASLTFGCGVASAAETLSEDFGEGARIGLASKVYAGAKLVGENCGSIFFDVVFEPTRTQQRGQRNLMSLRTASRTRLTFVTYKGETLQFFLSDGDKTHRIDFPEKLETNRVYRLGVTWDGEAVKVYRDGRVVEAALQVAPLRLAKVEKLSFGPFKDAWMGCEPWADDVLIRRIRVWNEARTPADVAAESSVAFRRVTEELPARLTVGTIPADVAAPTIDGKADEKAWDYAASMPQLVRFNSTGKSGEMPPHEFRLLCDATNLYLLAKTHFPGRVPYLEGLLRTADHEPQACGTESWELYLWITGHKYRLTSTAAGGTSDRRDNDYGWNPDWIYRQTRETKIDDSVVWTAEAAFPWAIFGLEGIPKEEIVLNFCRNWTLATFGGFSGLDFNGATYGLDDSLPRVTFAPSATYRLVERSDPSQGTYEESFALSADRTSEVVYEIYYAARDGSQAPMSAFRRAYRMKAGETLSDKLAISTAVPGYDALVHTLTQDGRVAMREAVPFDLDPEVATVTPLLLKGQVRVAFKKPFAGRLVLKGPDGKALYDEATEGGETTLAFSRDNPAGDYVVRFCDSAGKAVAEKHFNYPGRGEWEKQDFHEDWVLPPFTPLKTAVGPDGFESSLYGRIYGWKNAYLPTRIASLGEDLLAKPVELLVDGKPVTPESFEVTSNRPHHVGFSAQGPRAELAGWLEYDGVSFYRVTVRPEARGEIAVRYTLKPAFAKYYHAAGDGGWGSKRTGRVPDGASAIGKFPMLWIGNEEKGLCFFYETRVGWTGDDRRAYELEKTAEGLVVTVPVRALTEKGTSFAFEFGLLASPVRPRTSNYPFDTVGESQYSVVNRPGRRPVNDVSLVGTDALKSGDHASFYGDLDTPDARKTDAVMAYALEHHEKGRGARPVFYTAARHLSIRYPETAAYLPEWTYKPVYEMDYNRTGHSIFECCPTTSASAYSTWHARKVFERHPEMKGIYYDFGLVHPCSNPEHGCHDRLPILGQREFYRRHVVLQVERGIREPLIVLHNTDSVQLPAMTFATHLVNGEHLWAHMSSAFHQKRDILDTYDLSMFACELSTLPWGITSAAYMPCEPLAAKYGGDEKPEPYKFRMAKASVGVLLAHDSVQCLWRNHIGVFDKVIRALDAFGVDKATFTGYWRKPAEVTGAKGVLVSCWSDGRKVLAVIAHADKAHDDQTATIAFDWKKLGLAAAPKQATDLLPRPDPDYDWLYKARDASGILKSRVPLDIGDFGTHVEGFDGAALTYKIDHHTFGLVELK